ncbi:class F sortase [Actinoplanes sp. NEAU-A12]|uniref:Class F sortase n=1 Tax=Actinoplanes sandaracinus TaxID=3045177 RepID=A0ABT6WQS9_9ACTN|nr:class F sortase [Actinoplanes sandaracinus]MDI6102092.1 class F sortase [Actinoplanes sandaracinus]
MPSYGDIFVSLTTRGDVSRTSGLAVDRMPTADAAGTVAFDRTIAAADLPPGTVTHLKDLHVVQHGLDADGDGRYDVGALGESTLAKAAGLNGIPLVATGVAVAVAESSDPAAGGAHPTGAAAGMGDAARLTRGDLLPTSPPTRLEIPALGVDVPVTGLGLRPDGAMEVPADAKAVGWYTQAPTPGSLGPAVLAGHVDLDGDAGAFARLSTLRPGSEVRIARRDGTTAVFTVTKVDRYPKNRFPSDAVYGPIDHAGLRLITCGGDFDDRGGHYEDNIVAYAETTRTAR